jgi:hypothetical protein
MADHVVRDGGIRILRALLGLVAAIVAAGAVVLGAIASFELAAIVGGGYLAARTHEPILRGAGFGLVAGGLVAVLLWPLFAVDSGALEGR